MAWAENNILGAVGVPIVAAAAAGDKPPATFTVASLLTLCGIALLAHALSHYWARRPIAALRRAHAESLRKRDERLAQTAHELRTPLTAVMNALEIIRSGFATTAEEIEGFLEEADLAARHLSFLMNDVLDVAAIEAGKLRLEIADHSIAQLMQEGMRMLGMQAARNAITIHTEGDDRDLAVRADARRLLQILFNLVSNSIKHCEPGQLLEIIIRREAEHVLFRVLDEGRGVAAAVRPHLFTAFAGDEQHQRADSTGLGLQICRDLVDQMGGAIGYAPRPVGSEFWFTLPQAQNQVIAPMQPVAQ